MKQLIVLLFLSLCCSAPFAQNNDADYKLKFHQAQQAYEDNNFCQAATLAFEARNTAGWWTPALLYLYITSVYKSYQNSGCYQYSYDNFTLFDNYCNAFFQDTDKRTYPSDKYANIVTAQQYFQAKQKEFEYQKGRTPAKAVAFLNQCLQKFSIGQPVPDDLTRYYRSVYSAVYSGGSYIFQLDSPYLKIAMSVTTNSMLYGKRKDTYRRNTTFYTVELMDLSKAINIVNNKIVGQTNYENGTKVMQHFFVKSGSIEQVNYTNIDRQPPVETERNQKNQLKIQADTTGFPPQLKISSWEKPAEGFDIYKYFKTSSQEFVDGKYADRIKEAFQYLVDYYPKAKPKDAVQERANGF